MLNRFFKARVDAFLKNKKTVVVEEKPGLKTVIVEKKVDLKPTPVNPSSKPVYAFVGRKNVAVYDSITLCAEALGMTRAMVKKAIESGAVLENGFKLKLTNK